MKDAVLELNASNDRYSVDLNKPCHIATYHSPSNELGWQKGFLRVALTGHVSTLSTCPILSHILGCEYHLSYKNTLPLSYYHDLTCPVIFCFRGIDVVRNRIKMFAQKKVTLPKGRHKIIILDEADRFYFHQYNSQSHHFSRVLDHKKIWEGCSENSSHIFDAPLPGSLRKIATHSTASKFRGSLMYLGTLRANPY